MLHVFSLKVELNFCLYSFFCHFRFLFIFLCFTFLDIANFERIAIGVVSESDPHTSDSLSGYVCIFLNAQPADRARVEPHSNRIAHISNFTFHISQFTFHTLLAHSDGRRRLVAFAASVAFCILPTDFSYIHMHMQMLGLHVSECLLLSVCP